MNPAAQPIQVSVTVLAQMFLYLAALQVDIDAFLRSIGVDPAAIQSPDAYIPLETYLLIQEEAARCTRDPYFGLHMGEYAEAGSWSILGYMMMNCKTLGEAFDKSSRYSRIIGNLIEARAELRFKKIKVVFFTPPHAPQMSRHCFEAIFSSTVRMMQTLTGAPLRPLEVTFSHPEPASRAEYERIFGCPVYFGRRENAFTIDWTYINKPILMANAELLRYFEKYAQDFLTEMEQPEEVNLPEEMNLPGEVEHAAGVLSHTEIAPARTYTRAVVKILLARLDDETLSIEKVARQMAVSVRTLQNRLAEEGAVFSDLLKQVRERLAKQYLRENYTVEQITYLLGFSEPSVFRKAFKKWSGVTPKEYREKATAK